MTHDVPDTRTVSSSDYHAKCVGCAVRDKRIASLESQLATMTKLVSELREELAKEHAVLQHVQKEMEQWAHESGVNYKQAFLANQEVIELREELKIALNANSMR